MEQKITPGILVIAAFLVIVTSLLGLMLVNAFIFGNDNDGDSNSIDGLRLIPTLVSDDSDDNDEDDENDIDEDEPEDVAITGSALDKASAAALRAIGEGRVTDSEVGDEDGYYEIEITLDNGNEVDVHLDENFNVISKEYD